jgi:uncharacterized protein DUF4386
MRTAVIDQRIAETSPRRQARIAGVFYLANVVTSLMAFNRIGGSRLAFLTELVATACYIAVTVLFYKLFKPVNKSLSLIAAAFSLMGCLPGILSPLHRTPYHIPSLVFFGVYCLLIGYLILKSAFLPPILGVLMVFAGLGWLTFLSPSLAKFLSPYNYYPGGIGEISLCLWLLVMGVNAQRWKDVWTRRQGQGIHG